MTCSSLIKSVITFSSFAIPSGSKVYFSVNAYPRLPESLGVLRIVSLCHDPVMFSSVKAFFEDMRNNPSPGKKQTAAPDSIIISSTVLAFSVCNDSYFCENL